jgi:hypothetical protein
MLALMLAGLAVFGLGVSGIEILTSAERVSAELGTLGAKATNELVLCGGCELVGIVALALGAIGIATRKGVRQVKIMLAVWLSGLAAAGIGIIGSQLGESDTPLWLSFDFVGAVLSFVALVLLLTLGKPI